MFFLNYCFCLFVSLYMNKLLLLVTCSRKRRRHMVGKKVESWNHFRCDKLNYIFWCTTQNRPDKVIWKVKAISRQIILNWFFFKKLNLFFQVGGQIHFSEPWKRKWKREDYNWILCSMYNRALHLMNFHSALVSLEASFVNCEHIKSNLNCQTTWVTFLPPSALLKSLNKEGN